MGKLHSSRIGPFLISALTVFSWVAPPVAQAKDSTWGAILEPTARYQVLANFNGEAVLDRETGLIWERCPDVLTKVTFYDLNSPTRSAISACNSKVVGGRLGWRLPTSAELGSLGDPTDDPVLPHLAPFCVNNFQNTMGGPAPSFWTTTAVPQSDFMYAVSADSGKPTTLANATSASQPIWCVRGGGGSDNYR